MQTTKIPIVHLKLKNKQKTGEKSKENNITQLKPSILTLQSTKTYKYIKKKKKKEEREKPEQRYGRYRLNQFHP